jgi:hypothetical protein
MISYLSIKNAAACCYLQGRFRVMPKEELGSLSRDYGKNVCN